MTQPVKGQERPGELQGNHCHHEVSYAAGEHTHEQELHALRLKVAQLQEQLQQHNPENFHLAAPSSEDNEKQRLLQQLQKTSEERHQLHQLLSKKVAAQARNEEAHRRMQSELRASRERNKNLEQQLLLVDEQLVKILQNSAVETAIFPELEKSPETTHLSGVPSSASWAVQQLQGMRDNLKGIREKKPLGRPADVRRQPPLETVAFAPLQQLSSDQVEQRGGSNSPALSLEKQQQHLPPARRPQGATHLQQPQLASAALGKMVKQMHHTNGQQGLSMQEPAKLNASARRQMSLLGAACKTLHDAQPGGARLTTYESRRTEAMRELQQHQCPPVHRDETIVQVDAQLKGQSAKSPSHSLQLLQGGDHHPQHLTLNKPMHGPVKSHLAPTLVSVLKHPQVVVPNNADCRTPLSTQHATHQHHFPPPNDSPRRTASPQCGRRNTPSRLNNLKGLGSNAT